MNKKSSKVAKKSSSKSAAKPVAKAVKEPLTKEKQLGKGSSQKKSPVKKEKQVDLEEMIDASSQLDAKPAKASKEASKPAKASKEASKPAKASKEASKPAKASAKDAPKKTTKAAKAEAKSKKEKAPKEPKKPARVVNVEDLPPFKAFRILKTPVPKGRPRMDPKNARVYTPPETVKFEKDMKKELASFMPESKDAFPIYPHGVCLRVDIDFILERPQSLQGAEYKGGLLRHNVKPDLDNLSKSVLDAMNGIVFEDDNQVVELRLRKFYAEKNRSPRIHIKAQIVDFQSAPPCLCDSWNADVWEEAEGKE